MDKIKDKEASRKKLDNTLLKKSFSALIDKQNKVFEAVQWEKSHNEECEQKNRINRIKSFILTVTQTLDQMKEELEKQHLSQKQNEIEIADKNKEITINSVEINMLNNFEDLK